uniref:Protein FAM47E n=1 Tax=Geotrypetes seraphini TaxID=260995 RepID=A0A6P8SCP3_GEOSA|nr:protein FAM47E [Geotrypetes seraphini]
MEKLPQLADPDRSPRKRFPWYRKRLLPKYLKGLNNKLYLSDALNGRRWQFLHHGLDDFRDGYPLLSDRTCVDRARGPIPLLKNVPETSCTVRKSTRKRFTEYQSCFSKLLPLQQARKDYIDAIEYSLSQHPLALYPHLEESVPSELFVKVVDILDHELYLNSEIVDGSTEGQEQNWCRPQISKCLPKEKQVYMTAKNTSTRTVLEELKPKNPYTWLSKKKAKAKDDKHIRHTASPVIDENVKKVTKEFCDWVASLGGENYNIDEETLMSLFACGYETKPALSVPIHVVELNNVPAQLRKIVGTPLPQLPMTLSSKTDLWLSKDSYYSPRWEKTRFGAWYLHPQTWKKLKADEPLQDPNAGAYGVTVELLNKLKEKDEEIVRLHSTKAFKAFIDRKGYRRPEFLMKFFNQTPESMDRNTSRLSTVNLSKKNRWSASTHGEAVIN